MPWIRTRLTATALVLGPTITLGLMVIGSGAGAQTGSSSQPTLQSPAQPPPGGASPAASSKQAPKGTSSAPAPGTATQAPTTRPGADAPAPGAATAPPPPRGSSDPSDPNGRTDAARTRTGSGQDVRIDFGAQFRRGDNGLIVGTVREDGFLHDAGIVEGDQVVSINGQAVTSEDDFLRWAAAARGRVPMIVMRNGERRQMFVNFDDFQAQANPGPSQTPRAGLGIWFYQLPEGAQVVHVIAGSPAERAGIQVGDWIVRVNDSPIVNWATIVREIGQAEPKNTADLQVSRQGRPQRLQVRLAGYDEVFADAEDWNTIAARYQENRMPRGSRAANPTDNSGGEYQTGERGNGSPRDMQSLERRIRQLEQEVSRLREQLPRGNSTGTNGGNSNADKSPNGEK